MGGTASGAIPFFAFILQLEIISRTAQRPSLPLTGENALLGGQLGDLPEICPTMGYASRGPISSTLQTVNGDR